MIAPPKTEVWVRVVHTDSFGRATALRHGRLNQVGNISIPGGYRVEFFNRPIEADNVETPDRNGEAK